MRNLAALIGAGAMLLGACGSPDDGALFGSGTGGAPSGGGDGGALGGSAGTVAGGTGGGVDGGTGGVDGGVGATGGAPDGGVAGSGAGGSPGYTLDNICEKYPQQICALRAGCCQQAYGFNQAQCEANEKARCTGLVAEVNAGKRTFDPSSVDACLSGVAPLYQACFFTGDIEVDLFEIANTCGKIFPGGGLPDSACATQSDCAPSTAPNGYYGCGNDGKCFQSEILQQGAPCNYYFNVCASGLACATPSLTIANGTCQPATPTGSACSSSSQCGLGNYCTSLQCQPAQTTGGCSNFLHCLSLNCQNGQCAKPNPLVRQEQCGL